MRWIRYESNGHRAYGIVEGDTVIEVKGDPFAGYERTAVRLPLASVKLLVPVEPRTFYCAGLNYAEHVIEAARKRGQEPTLPKAADIGYRANNALIAHGEDIVIPKDATERINYEGELVVVIGKQVKHLSKADALSCVFGYTIRNDVSERTWQRGDRTFWRGKNADTFTPMGPWIDTDVDIDKMDTIVRVNGTEDLRFKTNDMIFDIPTYIQAVTRYLTLDPGDVIWMGTDGTSPDLKHGDGMDVELTGLGVLRNRFVREA